MDQKIKLLREKLKNLQNLEKKLAAILARQKNKKNKNVDTK